VPDWLRSLWDFEDLESTRARLRDQLEREDEDPRRAQVLTQLARVEGLDGRFEDGDRLLVEAEVKAGGDLGSLTRIALERGRLRNSSDSVEAARPLFAEAFELAIEAKDPWLAADAAHMAAIAAADDAEREAWTERGVRVATSSSNPADAYWVGPLLNNLGWAMYEAGRHAEALEVFESALEARERDPGRPLEIEMARYAVGRALRALGRPADAVDLLQRATSWADANGAPDGWFHEELAEGYAELGRSEEAAEHAATALELLAEQDPSLEADQERLARLRALATAR
jgi:tetratricopeptide (TPR) repeat protein